MHDVLEGVAIVEIKCMLTTMIQELRLFSLAMLNTRIQKFPYGAPDSANKPGVIATTTDSLKQSGKCNNQYTHTTLITCPIDNCSFTDVVPYSFTANNDRRSHTR